jgi:RNA-directed DNA polymerase
MACVRMRVTDGSVLGLIRGWLRAPVVEIDEKTGPNKCYKPTPKVVDDLNTFLRGWSNYFGFGYPRKAFRDVSYYARERMVTHLNRRSQRKYHRPEGMSHYQYLQELGLLNL